MRGKREAGIERVASGVFTECLWLAASVAIIFTCQTEAVEGQDAGTVQCFAVAVDDPDIVGMLGQHLRVDVLVLTEEPLRNSPGVTEGKRAYFGREEWRSHEPVRPGSWYWSRIGSDSVRVAFVLPVRDVVWTARETSEGLNGEVIYHSDVGGELPKASHFSGTRVECE